MKVYFNNSCKICRTEINMYKKQNIENLNWIDITKNKNAELETKKTDKELLRRLHVEKDGQIYVGIDGFLLIWKNIPKYNILYKFFKLPVIYQLFYVGYEIVAFFLYLKNRNQYKIWVTKDKNIKKEKNKIKYITVTALFLFLLKITNFLSSRKEISLSPGTG